jgi:type III pantothenate kinase
MQFVAVDIGNCAIKVAIDHSRQNDRWCGSMVFRDGDAFDFDLGTTPAFWSVCSVNQRRNEMLRDWVHKNRPSDKYYVIDHTAIDINTELESRGLVGSDRLIGAWMAIRMNDQRGPIIMIDAGTAVTIDFVDRRLIFQGGVIFPGASACLQALAQTTEALPDLSQPSHLTQLGNLKKELIGYSTQTAILRGVYHAQISAIKSIVAKMIRASSDEASVYATGGGISQLEKYLPLQWNFVPDLVLRGTRAIGHRHLFGEKAES